MLFAKNDDRFIHANEALKKEYYTCPACQQAVCLKKGKTIRAHFAHLPNKNCSFIFSEGETNEHIMGKEIIFSWLEDNNFETHMEYYIPYLSQRPDVMLISNNGINIAIEFQCSPISNDQLIVRTMGYYGAEINVHWILGEKYAPTRMEINDGQFKFLSLIDGKIGILILNVTNKKIFFYEPSQKTYKHVDWIKHSVEMKADDNKIIKMKLDTEHQIYVMQYYKKYYDYLIKQRRHKSSKYTQFFEYLYYKNIQLYELPNEILHVLPCDYLLKSPSIFWKTIIILMINSKYLGESFEFLDILHALKSILLHNEPQQVFLGEAVWSTPVLDFLDYLIAEGYLYRDGVNTYRKLREFSWYKNETEKLEAIRRL